MHPPGNKISQNKSITRLPLPEQVQIPLAQHIGAPAKPIVKPADEVKEGDLIAQSAGFISANIHASVTGKVLKIGDCIDATGYKTKSILIQTPEGLPEEKVDRSDDLVEDFTHSPETIRQRVSEAGVVGLGGATFPSHVKLSVPEGKKCDFLIINGVECEPYLTADHQLMLEKAKEIIVGIRIILKALGVNKALIGIENNKPDAIRLFDSLTATCPEIEVHALKVEYPQGGEKQLIKALVDREVPPPPGLPIDVGCVVFNVGTTYAIYQAVQKHKPLYERVVTVTGTSLTNASNFLVRIGTPVHHVIKASRVDMSAVGKVISGGPMMGKALKTLDVPVTKGTSGILLIDDKQAHRHTIRNCIRCGRCVNVCPLGLEPYLLATLSRKSMFEEAEKEKIYQCMECGCCSYTCPSNRPLVDYIRYGKSVVMNMIRQRGKK